MRTLKLGTFSPSVLVAVATETGALAHAGLAVEEVPAASSPAQFAALMDGALDAVVTNPDNVVAYRCVTHNPLRRNADVRILAAIDQGLGLGLYGRTTRLHDTVVGVDVPTSGFAFVAFELLTRLGLRPNVDYTTVALGATPHRATALLNGQCDLTLLNAGSELRAEAAGAHRIASVTSLGPYVGAVLAARGSHVPELGDLVAALLETSSRLVAGGLAEAAVAAARERLGLAEDLAVRHVRKLVDPAEGLVANGVMPLDAVATVVDLRNRHSPGPDRLTSRSVLAGGLLDISLLGGVPK